MLRCDTAAALLRGTHVDNQEALEMTVTQFPALLNETYTEWSSDKCLRLGAA